VGQAAVVTAFRRRHPGRDGGFRRIGGREPVPIDLDRATVRHFDPRLGLEEVRRAIDFRMETGTTDQIK